MVTRKAEAGVRFENGCKGTADEEEGEGKIQNRLNKTKKKRKKNGEEKNLLSISIPES